MTKHKPPKGYQRKNYYSRNTISANSQNANIKIDKGTSITLIRNTYVHSGLYNFKQVVEGYQNATNTFLNGIELAMEKDFKKEIAAAKALEEQIYAAASPDVDSATALQRYLSFDNTAQRVLDSLDIYKFFDQVLNNLPPTKDGYVQVNTIQKKISQEISNGLTDIAKDMDEKYASIFRKYRNLFSAKNFFIAQSSNVIALKKLQDSKSKFMNISKYQGALGELATLLDQVGKAKGATEFTTELKKGTGKSGNITLKNLGSVNLKSDIGVSTLDFEFGIQSKNYHDTTSNIGIHSGGGKSKNNTTTVIKDLFNIPILQQAATELQINTLFKEVKTTNAQDFEKFLQYCIVNAQSFKASGVYLKRSDKKPKGKSKISNDYTTINIFSKEAAIIQELSNYLATYWIGVKILEGNKNIKNKRIAFYYLGNKIIPISQILSVIYNQLSTENPVIITKFRGVKVFTPSVLNTEKWEALKKSGNPPKKWNKRKEYPEQLLKMGASIGKASVDNMTFSIEMNVKELLKNL